ncbi:hypothetical protein V1478_007106 [Vespula squamosa]|uniref:Uncharacterized protein n=1 Tax=Vespula squamosa TaxID=30214 RepID=A0ABD2B2B4_VESSQ
MIFIHKYKAFPKVQENIILNETFVFKMRYCSLKSAKNYMSIYRKYYRPRSHRVEVAACGDPQTLLFITTTTIKNQSNGVISTLRRIQVSNVKIAAPSVTAYSGTNLHLAELS